MKTDWKRRCRSNKKILKIISFKSLQLSKYLREQMLTYCKINNNDRISNVKMDFIRRIEVNLCAVDLLAKQSTLVGGTTYFKLPMGLLLRSCFVDLITGFYICSKGEKEAEEEIDIMNIDYLKSYKAKFEALESDFGAGSKQLCDSLYKGMLEDAFPQYLNFDDLGEDGTFPLFTENEIRTDSNTYKGKIQTDKLYRELKSNSQYSSIISNVYVYYRYFSQYEHFSEYSHGDTLAPYCEDNVSFPDALKVLGDATDMILEQVNKRI